MIHQCDECKEEFDDVTQWASCPHDSNGVRVVAGEPTDDPVQQLLAAANDRMLAAYNGIEFEQPSRIAADIERGGVYAIGGEVAEDGSREHGLPGWHQSAANGRWYPPTQTLGEISTALKTPEVDDPDVAAKLAAVQRYTTAAEQARRGVAMLAQRMRKFVEPVELRLGIDTQKVEQGALATLLIAKGVFTELEYFEAMAEAMDREVSMIEGELSAAAGRPMRLR